MDKETFDRGNDLLTQIRGLEYARQKFSILISGKRATFSMQLEYEGKEVMDKFRLEESHAFLMIDKESQLEILDAFDAIIEKKKKQFSEL